MHMPKCYLLQSTGLSDEFGDERGPAGLVRGTQTLAGVAVEVLRERDLFAPVAVVVEQGDASVGWPPTFRVRNEERDQAPRQLGGYFPQVHGATRPGGALDGECVAEIVMEPLQR